MLRNEAPARDVRATEWQPCRMQMEPRARQAQRSHPISILRLWFVPEIAERLRETLARSDVAMKLTDSPFRPLPRTWQPRCRNVTLPEARPCADLRRAWPSRPRLAAAGRGPHWRDPITFADENLSVPFNAEVALLPLSAAAR